jgi:hypothetical protein
MASKRKRTAKKSARAVEPKKRKKTPPPTRKAQPLASKSKKAKKSAPKARTQKKSFTPPKKVTVRKSKAPSKKVQTVSYGKKRPPTVKKPKRVTRPKAQRASLAQRIAQGAPIFAAFVAQRQIVRELERKLEESKAVEYERAERAAIEADSIGKEAGIAASEAFERSVRWLRQDSTPAKQPSILRHYVEADEWRRQLQLIGQGDPDSKLFRRQAKIIARETGVSIREVYTLWWSP